MSEFITDRDLSSIGETNMAAYAGLTITDGGVCLQRTELPQAVTVAGALSTEGESSPIVYLSFVDGEMWSEKKQARTIELLQGRCKEKGVSVTFVTEKPESGKYSTVYVGAASILKAYGADEDLSKQDYSDGVAYADTNTGLLGNKEYVIPQEVNEIAEQISNLTEIDLSLPSYQKEDYLMQNNDSIVYLEFVDEAMWSKGKQAQAIELLQTRCKRKDVSITFVTEKPESGKYSTVYVGAASVLKAYGADEDLSKQDYSDGVAYADTNTGLLGNKEYVIPQEVNEIAEQISNLTEIDLSLPSYQKEDYLMQNNDSIVYLEFVDGEMWSASISLNNVTYVANPDRNLPDQLVCWVTKPQTDSAPMAFISTMDAETEAVQSVQVACAEDDGWRTIGTLNNLDGIDWKYQVGNLTGSGTPSVVWHAQELGALGVWTDGTDNWTAVDGWFDANWTMLGCGDFDGDGKDSVLMSLYGGLFYSVDLDGTLVSLGDLNWSGWEFGAVGDFAGDGRDDVVLLHRESGTVVMLADGNADAFERLGQLDATDWSVAGAGDFDADGKDDLLVRQNSTSIAGAYASADMSKWSTVTSDYLLA